MYVEMVCCGKNSPPTTSIYRDDAPTTLLVKDRILVMYGGAR
jgi:hypothetical protein